MEDVADLGAFVVLGQQAAYLEDQLTVAVVENANLRVGGLAVVDVAEATADAESRAAQLVLAQAPAGDVHLVDALAAQVAVAVVPDPVPIVVDRAVPRVVAHRRLVRRRATPEVEVHRLGRLLGTAHLADAGPRLVA